VPVLKTNTIEVLSNYSQSFPIGTNLQVNYLGQRVASNTPYNAINPELYSNFQVKSNSPSGRLRHRHQRALHPHRQAQLPDHRPCFQSTGHRHRDPGREYLLGSRECLRGEQISERSLGFANKNLSDDQKQLELQAIPAMQVMTDQSAVATAEGNLTVARASLRLNELLMKNALTKVDDPAIDEMPVIPLDLQGEPDPNADKSIDDLIAEAEKKRPEVAIYQMQAEVQKQASEGHQQRAFADSQHVWLYAGAGTAGPKNPNCNLGTQDCTTNLPTGFPSMFENTFNYSSPEYQVGMTLSINLRNRQAKADQFRAVLQYRQSQISSSSSRKHSLRRAQLEVCS
jgi:hypothetical protein